MVWAILGIVVAIVVPFVIYLMQRRPQPVVVTNVPPPVVQPVWMQNGDEYRQLIDGLERDEYEVKETTREGAQGYLRSPDGWQRVSVAGRTVEMGGTLSNPEHWPICRRVASYGLSDNAKRVIVAAYLNRDRLHSVQFNQAAYQYEPRFIVSNPPLELRGAGAFQALDDLQRASLITRQKDMSVFYVLVPRAADAAKWMLEKRRVPSEPT